MPSVTGTVVVEAAFALLNVYLPGESVPGADGDFALEMLNDWLSEQSQKALMCPAISRNQFDLVANQGGLDNPYTIGSGANFNVTKPPNQNSITAANLILTESDPDGRVSLTILTDQAYDALAVPDLTSAQPTALYYTPFRASASNEYGLIYLWPEPDNATNDIEIFIQLALLQFADLSTTYYVPAGVPRMLKYALADILQVPYGKTLSARAIQTAVSTLGTFKRANTKLSDLATDAYMFARGRSTRYNIETGG